MDDINKKIKTIIDSNNIVLFMKGTPEAPQCGFSMAVLNILKYLKVKFEGINVLANDEIRQGIKNYTDWPTIPQLYIKGEFIGGCDIIKEMFEKGELKELLRNKSLI
jgi:monothiol glutaredoxin